MSISDRSELMPHLRAPCLALLAASLMASAPLAAQAQQERPDVGDVAMTPLNDLGITSKNIPRILIRAVDDPYTREGLHTCNSIAAEVGRLDAVLGADYDAYAEGKGGFDVGRLAQGVVGSLIPFRGVVREVSGAASKDRDMAAAITAGMVRRGFLKGMGQQRGCKVPARPRARPAPGPDDETIEPEAETPEAETREAETE
jgi:hypothetical protein